MAAAHYRFRRLCPGAVAGLALVAGLAAPAPASPMDTLGPAAMVIDLPLVDVPFNFEHGFYAPSMAQSVAVTKSLHEAAFFGIDRLAGRIFGPKRAAGIAARDLAAAAFVAITGYTPLGVTWAHEEFHRAVLRHRGVGSYDNTYGFPFFSDLVAVNHVSDSDLVRLKRDYPRDLVRAHEAGYEAQQLLVSAFHQDDFFRARQRVLDLGTLLCWYSDLDNVLYVGLCNISFVDTLTARANRAEGADVARRDFTGYDFTAWVYDLFRPGEPYAARGTHPSGVGIDRYIRRSELTAAERRYLATEFYLSLASLADPLLFGYRGVAVGTATADAYLQHFLTPFGHAVNLSLLLKRGQWGCCVSLLNQQNRVAYFPGLDVRGLNWPARLGRTRLWLSPRLCVWTQPRGQDFETRVPVPGALASVRVDCPIVGSLGVNLEVEGKTRGWVAGNVALDPGVSARLGLGYLAR